MSKQGPSKRSPPDSRSRSSRGGRLTMAAVLKWIGIISAVLSFAFAVQQGVQMVSDMRERTRKIEEQLAVAEVQRSTADYASAWANLEEAMTTAESGGLLAKVAGRVGDDRRRVREAQEDLAMDWIDHLSVNVTQGETFTSVVSPLTTVVTRGVTASEGQRKADLLAHLGWAHFLLWRDGQRQLDPARSYEQALAVDPENTFAHAYLAHWRLWTEHEAALPEAKAHFAAALATGRGRGVVRSLQLGALSGLGEIGEAERLVVIADMLAQQEPVDAGVASRVYGSYWSECSSYWRGSPPSAQLTALVGAIPLADHLAIFDKLFGGFDARRAEERDACRATVLELAGRRDDARQIWVNLRNTDKYADPMWRQAVDAALKRLSRR